MAVASHALAVWVVGVGVWTGCAGGGYRDEVRSPLLQRDLLTAFKHCTTTKVEKQSATDYRVLGCGEVATYSCQDPAFSYVPSCAVDAVRVAKPGELGAEPPPPPVLEAWPDGDAAGTAAPAASAPAAADHHAEADQLFKQGRELVKAKQFAEACERFARADALERTPGTAFNLGDCALRDKRISVAWRAYNDAANLADRRGNGNLARFARAQASVLMPQLTTVVVTLADPDVAGLTVRINDRELPAASEIRTLTDPGVIEVVVSAPGTPGVRRTLHGAAGASVSVTVPAH